MAAVSIRALQYSIAVLWSAPLPRKSRPGPMAAQMEPQAMPCLSNAAFSLEAVTCDGSSIAISIVSKPHFLNLGMRLKLLSVKGEV